MPGFSTAWWCAEKDVPLGRIDSSLEMMGCCFFQWSAWDGWVSGRYWLRDPPVVRASICMPRQIPRTGILGLLWSSLMSCVSNVWRAARTGVISWWEGTPKGSVLGSSPPERMKASKRVRRVEMVSGLSEIGGRMMGMAPAL